MTDRIEFFYRRLARQIQNELSSACRGRIFYPKDLLPNASIHRNLYRILLTDEGKRLFALAGTEEHFLSEENSDYENFVQMLHLLPNLVGSGYPQYASTVIEALCGETASISPENSIGLWNASVFAIEMLQADNGSFFHTIAVTDIQKWVYPDRDLICAYAQQEHYIEAYENQISACDALYLNLSGMFFCSPDPYHAELGFRALQSGDPDPNASVWLFSQMMRVTGELCKKKGIPLILGGYDQMEHIMSLVHYLERHDRLPKMLITLPMDSAEQAIQILSHAEACGLLQKTVGLVPTNLHCASHACVHQCFTRIADRYPMGKLIYFAEGESISEAYIGSIGFLRSLSDILAEQICFSDCLNEQTVISIGKQIAYENAERLLGQSSQRMDNQ